MWSTFSRQRRKQILAIPGVGPTIVVQQRRKKRQDTVYHHQTAVETLGIQFRVFHSVDAPPKVRTKRHLNCSICTRNLTGKIAIYRVERVECGLPADQADLKPGDYVVFINKTNVVMMAEDDVMELIK